MNELYEELETPEGLILLSYPSHCRNVHVASPVRFKYLQFYYHLHTNRRRHRRVKERYIPDSEGQGCHTIMGRWKGYFDKLLNGRITDLTMRMECQTNQQESGTEE